MRFHIVSLPHTQTTTKYSWCAYTEKVRKFCNMMMSLGHEVFLYAGEHNEANCTEHVPIIFDYEIDEWFGHIDWQREVFGGWNVEDPWWRTSNARAAVEIAKRSTPDDFLGIIAGLCQKPLADQFPELLPCEWGIGYSGVFSNYRVFESYAWMHTIYGQQRIDDGRFFDAVIPNFFEPHEFPQGSGDGGYYLFIGRLIPRKGPHIAAQVCSHLSEQLIVAGQGATSWGDGRIEANGVVLECPQIEYVGVVGPEERAELMGGAKAVFVPTLYVEPFGGVAVEAMMCGTPVITTDWGAFTETVAHGVSGFRCRSFAEFVDAAREAPSLDRNLVRDHAFQYSTERVRFEYERYFTHLKTLRSGGWYEMDFPDWV